MSAKRTSTEKQHPLVGKAFLSYTLKPSGEHVTGWQGVIEAVVPSGSAMGDLALVQLYDWIAGAPYSHLIPLTTLAAPPHTGELWFKFFNSAEERNSYSDRDKEEVKGSS